MKDYKVKTNITYKLNDDLIENIYSLIKVM